MQAAGPHHLTLLRRRNPGTKKRMDGSRTVRRTVTCYNLDAIISVEYRVNSILGVKFRQWATSVLKLTTDSIGIGNILTLATFTKMDAGGSCWDKG